MELRSELCKASHFSTPWYERWCAELNEKPRFHRKQWEFVYVLQALAERGCIRAGASGLVFAVGSEPIPSILAKKGCFITATDLDFESGVRAGWMDADQLYSGVHSLNKRALCSDEIMQRQVGFRAVNMNEIPGDLRGFDFNWSCCALEHLGSLEKSADFVFNQLETIKPGGWCIHTTEFNVSSNTDTIDSGDTVVFRQKDIDRMVRKLRKMGHYVEDVDYSMGNLREDYCVDWLPHLQNVHLKLQLDRFVVTSIGIIIRKKKRRIFNGFNFAVRSSANHK